MLIGVAIALGGPVRAQPDRPPERAGATDPARVDERERPEYREVLEARVHQAQEMLENARPGREQALGNVATSTEATLNAFDAYMSAVRDFDAARQGYEEAPSGSARDQALLKMQQNQATASNLRNQYRLAYNTSTIAIREMQRQNKAENAALAALRSAGSQAVPRRPNPPRSGDPADVQRVNAVPAVGSRDLLARDNQPAAAASSSAAADLASAYQSLPAYLASPYQIIPVNRYVRAPA
ncbi:MAG: hypothetical protein JOZ05_01100, partial [Acetobacteraceae bacterium]|nr:hypothetical protein [Acetobacteraceae bacterium]